MSFYALPQGSPADQTNLLRWQSTKKISKSAASCHMVSFSRLKKVSTYRNVSAACSLLNLETDNHKNGLGEVHVFRASNSPTIGIRIWENLSSGQRKTIWSFPCFRKICQPRVMVCLTSFPQTRTRTDRAHAERLEKSGGIPHYVVSRFPQFDTTQRMICPVAFR